MAHLPDGDRPARGDRPLPHPTSTEDAGSEDSWQRWIGPAVAILVGAILLSGLFSPGAGNEVDYSRFLDQVEAGEIATATIDSDGRIEGETAEGEAYTTVLPTATGDRDLVALLRENDVEVDATAPSAGWLQALIGFAPFLLLIGFFWWMSRRARGQMGQITGIMRSRKKIIDRERPETGFDDVAGYAGVKEEVREIIDYLRDPRRYAATGARGPGGVLLVGPPGTGKTLLARAVAGEADVPFISVAGSSFVEMLVGVGAARVRDLFEEARKRAPAIIFIDELDSVGRKRGSAATIGSHNEQEQTLNQLLAELDGFDPREGVVVLAATNRPEMLDPALLRPGRFDRRVTVPPPLLEDRKAILHLHADDKPLASDVDLERVARGTPGFSGADLENLVNEAAVHAVRDGREEVAQADFDAARDRLLLGRRDEALILTEDEKERIAVHEAGHALTAALQPEADPVSKVTIMPTRKALGNTQQLPLEDQRLHAESYLDAKLTVLLGGRAAEHLVLGEGSTGGAQDLRGATALAMKMVSEFGLSPRLGPVGWASQNGEYVPVPLRQRPYAEATGELIDDEVRRLVGEAEDNATRMLQAHRDALDELVSRLLEDETVDGDFVYELVGRQVPQRSE
ncbi:MAG: ATP-dependent zinc metalloprotease FtsH [Actinobacteria bacterium]|nr:ATP-dependent zinc metalloprotease FtsH [Actinomycetota bacterium]